MGRLKLWSGVLGIRSLEQAASEQARNREAESAYVRRTAWGDNGKPTEGSDVNDTVLGDMTTVHNHHQAAPSQLGKILLGAGLLATGIGIPAGAWMLASGAKDAIVKPSEPPAAVTPAKPEQRAGVKMRNYSLRLGK